MGASRATAGASLDKNGPRGGGPSDEDATADMQRVRMEASVDAGEDPTSKDAARTAIDAGGWGMAGDDAARTGRNGCLECKRRYEVYCWHR